MGWLDMKMLLMNVYVSLNEGEEFFTVDKYKIYPSKLVIIRGQDIRRHVQNAFVEFNGRQEDSILFSGGITGDIRKPRKRKLIDDVLVVGSLLNGRNWVLRARMNYQYPSSPVISHPYLEDIGLHGRNQIESYFNTAFGKIKNIDWQQQYENGFHLRMLLNRANITNNESRFISNMVIWEWLYPHLTNPNRKESHNLHLIINEVLKHFFSSSPFNGKKEDNIFYVLRNQLAHSGKIPINRLGVSSWMINLSWNGDANNPGIKKYLSFFGKLTQVVVLKTLGIDSESIISNELDNFLKNGILK